MSKKALTFLYIEFQKNKFCRYKNPFLKKTHSYATEKAAVSNKISFGEKNCRYFIGYLHDDYKIKPSHIMLPKTKAYVKGFNGQTKCIYFLIEHGDLSEK